MRVVLVSQAYPPHSVVGALRAGNLVSALLEAGHQVTVITQSLGPSDRRSAERRPGLRVVPVEVGAGYSRRLRAVTGAIPGRQREPVGAAESPDAVLDGSHGPMRRAVLALLSLPDPDQHLILPFTRAARRVIAKGADLLYTSAPPFSTHVAGLWLHRSTGIPWVAELRDPWNYPGSGRRAAGHPLVRGLDAFLERRVLRRADAVVVVTEAARELLAERMGPALADKLLLARNGVPDWGAGSAGIAGGPGAGPFTLVYTGSLYFGRNPLRFLEGLRSFITRTSVPPSELQVQLIGRCADYNGASVPGVIAGLGLESYVRLEDWLPHDTVRERLQAADALLIFAQDQPLQVPNKVYEYLAVGAPVLGFLDRGGESARLLQNIPGSEFMSDPTADDVAAALTRLMARRSHPAGMPAPEVPETLKARVQMERLVAELARRFGSGGRAAG